MKGKINAPVRKGGNAKAAPQAEKGGVHGRGFARNRNPRLFSETDQVAHNPAKPDGTHHRTENKVIFHPCDNPALFPAFEDREEMHQKYDGEWDCQHGAVQLCDHAKADVKRKVNQILQGLFPDPFQRAVEDKAHEKDG